MLMARKKVHPQGYSARDVDTRQQRQRFLIVCEGTKTEPNYFEGFRVPKDVIDVVGLGENPSRLVDSARRLNEKGDYDQVWCVFDRDDWTKQDFNNALQTAKQYGFKVAYSNEAFELWYVLHFEFLNTGVPRADYAQKLTRLLGKPYRKNSSETYDLLMDRQQIAMKNAAKLLEYYAPLKPAEDNPSTTVHLLVAALNEFAV